MRLPGHRRTTRHVAADREYVMNASRRVRADNPPQLITALTGTGQMSHRPERGVLGDSLSGLDRALSGCAAGSIGHGDEVGAQRLQLTNRLPKLALLDLIFGWEELEGEKWSIPRRQQVGNAHRTRAPETFAARHANTLKTGS